MRKLPQSRVNIWKKVGLGKRLSITNSVTGFSAANVIGANRFQSFGKTAMDHESLPESALPLLPPKLDDYKPTSDGQPPLARAKEWVNLPDGSTRETNTMPQWAGSCWYYLRYLDVQNSHAFVGEEAERYWMIAPKSIQAYHQSLPPEDTATINATFQTSRFAPNGVDLYVGGAEHAVLHLLYARFWHKLLYDLGYVSTREPFFKLVNQGLILGETN